MPVVLASTWHPRGELARFEKIAPLLHEMYAGLVVSLPPEPDPHLVNSLMNRFGVFVVVSPDWSWGRHLALQSALELPGNHVHYVDFDRLLRWVETRADEWRKVVERTQELDCLIVGRTEQAYRTHPKALVLTEKISNLVTSHLLGQQMDVSAGCKGFSHQAAKFLIANCEPGNALGTDAEWPVLLHRAGFDIEYMKVEGLDWEIPDQYQCQASGEERQRRQAEIYDANPENWERRVKIALEIVQVALEASTRQIKHDYENT
jgi:hypothetical protein